MLLRLVLCIGTTLLLFEVGAASSLYGRASGALNFIVLGDWGGQDDSPYTTMGEENVAEQMGKTAAEVGSQFTLSLGDNFYENGVTNVDDPRFKETFEVSNGLSHLIKVDVEQPRFAPCIQCIVYIHQRFFFTACFSHEGNVYND